MTARAVTDGHPSEAAGYPTALAADPRAGQRTSPPTGCPARVAPSYLALLRVEFAAFHSVVGLRRRRHRHCGTGPRLTTDGRYPPPCAGELGRSSRRERGCPRRARGHPTASLTAPFYGSPPIRPPDHEGPASGATIGTPAWRGPTVN